MLKSSKRAVAILSSLVASGVLAATFAGEAMALEGPVVRDSAGGYMVRCHVVRAGGDPNHVIGYVVGNHPKNADIAEKAANDHVSGFKYTDKGVNHHYKRHCQTRKKYYPAGMYDKSMNRIIITS